MPEPVLSLFPYDRVDIFSMQQGAQEAPWSITAFDLPEVWKMCKGEGVIIGAIDSGANLNHQDLVENLLPGLNVVEPGHPPEDSVGHGTHTVGIMVAVDNDFGVVGVAPQAKVRPVKVLDAAGNGSVDNVAAGVRWCIQQKVDFINLSLGCLLPIPKLHEAIIEASNAGIIIFCAAGNSGNTKEVFYPSAYPETISVGAIDALFHRAAFSNTGLGLDFLAPGVDILSTVPNNWYARFTGTSMAGPFACGVCALLLSYVRKTPDSGIVLNSVNDYIKVLKEYAIPLVDGNTTQFYQGYGIIDPRKFVEFVKVKAPVL